MFISKLPRIFADPDLALDLGTANTRLYALGLGMVADEPSTVNRGRGSEASEMLELERSARSNSIVRRVAPLRSGVITDVDAATQLLEPLVRRAQRYGLIKPRAIACAPTDVSETEREALIEATRRAGVSAVKVVPEPLAAAVGAGLDLSLPYAQMLVDIGDGVTDIAVIRSGELVKTAAIRLACSDMHEAVRRMVARSHKIVLYRHEAERLVEEIGAVEGAYTEALASEASGVHYLRRGEEQALVSSREVSEAIQPVVRAIMEKVRETLRHLNPQLAVEVIESGITLTGGGAQLKGISELMASETSMEVRLADNPLHSVINGASQMLSVGTNIGIWDSAQR